MNTARWLLLGVVLPVVATAALSAAAPSRPKAPDRIREPFGEPGYVPTGIVVVPLQPGGGIVAREKTPRTRVRGGTVVEIRVPFEAPAKANPPKLQLRYRFFAMHDNDTELHSDEEFARIIERPVAGRYHEAQVSVKERDTKAVTVLKTKGMALGKRYLIKILAYNPEADKVHEQNAELAILDVEP